MTVETLPAHWYVDPEVFRRERAEIFAKNWLLFGPAAGLTEPGQYRAETVNGWPILIVRDKDGVLRGFHNVCRHRGARIAADGTGQCRRLVCPYHGWSYDLTGALRQATNFGDHSAIDKSQFSLYPIRVDTWANLVFISIDHDGPDFQTWLGSLNGLCDSYFAPSLEPPHTTFTLDGACNWKAYCDNTVEGYHLSSVHKGLSATVDDEQSDIVSYDDGTLVVFDITYRQGTARGNRDKGLWFYKFPGFQCVTDRYGFSADRIEAISPGRMRYTTWQWYDTQDAEQRQQTLEFSRQIVGEDIGICETVQSNLEIGIYKSGLLSPDQETHTARFQEIVREALAPASPQ